MLTRSSCLFRWGHDKFEELQRAPEEGSGSGSESDTGNEERSRLQLLFGSEVQKTVATALALKF